MTVSCCVAGEKKAKGILGNISRCIFIRNRSRSTILELFWVHMFKNLKQIQRGTTWITRKIWNLSFAWEALKSWIFFNLLIETARMYDWSLETEGQTPRTNFKNSLSQERMSENRRIKLVITILDFLLTEETVLANRAFKIWNRLPVKAIGVKAFKKWTPFTEHNVIAYSRMGFLSMTN